MNCGIFNISGAPDTLAAAQYREIDLTTFVSSDSRADVTARFDALSTSVLQTRERPPGCR
jgi:hypothetical protein